MEMYGNGMEMYLNSTHNSRTRGVSSKQMLVRVSRKTYEYCCLRRDDVPRYQSTPNCHSPIPP